jgi:hypothetical protein
MLAEVREITATFPAPGIRRALFLALTEALLQRGDTEAAGQAENEYQRLCDELSRVASRISTVNNA